MNAIRPLTVTVADVCFCHWPVDADALGRLVPAWLDVETADGDAWVTAIPHTVAGVSSFGLDLSAPAESVTVRTYVRGPDGQRGLYFFAAFTTDPLASAAGPVLRLPYRDGTLARRALDDGRTERTLDVDGRRVLNVQYEPSDGEATVAPADSLPAFLIERYRVFAEGPVGSKLVAGVGHDPWTLGSVEATVDGGLLSALSLPEPVGDPLVHYSPGNELDIAPPGPLWLD